MSSPRLTIVRRELAGLKSEKTIVLAILIQLFIAMFSSFLVVGLVSLYDPGAVSDEVSVPVGVTGNASDDFSAVAEGRTGLATAEYETYGAAMADFERGELAAVVRADREPTGKTQVTAVVPESGFQATFVVVQVKDALTRFERAERSRLESRLVNEPLDPGREVEASPYFDFIYTVLLPLLTFLPVFLSGSIAVDSLVEEIERGTLDLLRVTPLSFTAILDGKAGAMALLAPLQAGTWLALLSLNGTPISNPGAVLTVVAAFAVIVVAIGMLIAVAFGDRERSQFAYSMAILFLFGGTYLLPENPANTVARLAIGSPGETTRLAVAAYVGVALVVGIAARHAVVRAERRLS